MRATSENNRPGRWGDSYGEEAAAGRPSTLKVRFHRYTARHLQSFWQQYRQDDTYNFTHRNCSSAVARALDAALEGRLPELAQKTVAEVEACFADMTLHKALMAVWELVGVANKYIVENEPWSLAKDPAQGEKLAAIMYRLLEVLRAVAILISPFMPQAAQKILQTIGLDAQETCDLNAIRSGAPLPAGAALSRGESLFPRVSAEKEAPPPKKPAVELKPEIDYDEFSKVDLRVAKILSAEAVPKSNKLVKLRIDIGEERTIVAGIGKDYKPQELVGKSIVIVANLKPAKLMGVESHGMLLATDSPEGLTLIGFDREPKTGAKVR